MNHCFIDDFCTASVSFRCDQTCQQEGHIPPNMPLYDGHIHLNQTISKIHTDLISVRKTPPIREFHFVNNNHKPSEWLISNFPPFLSHVHVYPTIGIHPKYFDSQSLYQNLDDLKTYLEISHNFIGSREVGWDTIK
jgi:Tat protein secretion system quality control protein TatD with DNase activity